MNPTNTYKQKVDFVIAKRIGDQDNQDVFFVPFQPGMAGMEYLMIPKNGEAEPKPGIYEVPPRHQIDRFELSKIDGGWFVEFTKKATSQLLTK